MSKCTHRPLVRGSIARVDHCPECAVVSIHLGPTTVRLDPDASESLWATLGEALAVLRARRDRADIAAPLPRGAA